MGSAPSQQDLWLDQLVEVEDRITGLECGLADPTCTDEERRAFEAELAREFTRANTLRQKLDPDRQARAKAGLLPQDLIDQVVASVDVHEVFRSWICPDLQQREGQREATGTCPDCRKPKKFSVSTEKRCGKCWSCGYSCGLVKGVMRFANLDFRPAMSELGRLAGIDVPEPVGRSRPVQLSSTGSTEQAKDSEAKRAASDFNQTELGQAEFMIQQYGDQLRYCIPWKSWLVWDGRRWCVDAGGLKALNLANQSARDREAAASDVADPKEKMREFAFGLRCETARIGKAILDQAKTLPGVAVYPDQLDAEPMLLNVLNGTLELETGTLRPHCREDFITKLAPVHFNPRARCREWLLFLHKIHARDWRKIRYLQRCLGYGLTGRVVEHCLFYFYGPGRNGKGTTIETVSDILGEYSQKASFAVFLARKNVNPGAPTPEIARLKGARFVHATEANEGQKLDEAQVKELTGGDTLTARGLNQDFFDFSPTHKLFWSANYRLRIVGQDEGIWSRIHLVPFDVVIPKADRDKGLLDRLKGEREGILAWLVRGCLDWQRRGLNPPKLVTDATEDYQQEQREADPVWRFLHDESRVVLGPGYSTPAHDLFISFKFWCGDHAEPIISQTLFGRRLSRHGLEKGKSGTVSWRGAGLRNRQNGAIPPHQEQLHA